MRPRPTVGLPSAPAVRWAVLLLALAAPCARAQDSERQREYAVKAAFLLNFARFVDWPASAFPSPTAPLVIGVVGRDPYGPVLERSVQGKTVSGHSFQVRRVKWDSDLTSLHILVVPDTERPGASGLPGLLKGAPVLTVGESAGLAQKHVHINFYLDKGQVRFEINPDSARRARLTISSRLLGLARTVQDAR